MGGGGGDSQPTYTKASYDPNQIATFMNTAAAKQYSPGDLQQLYNIYHVSQGPNGTGTVFSGANGVQPANSAMVQAFETWVNDTNQQNANWQNYANAASANEGGEGDQTITSGAATSQTKQLLGALANPNAPASPTASLGAMGSLYRNGVPVPPGGTK